MVSAAVNAKENRDIPDRIPLAREKLTRVSLHKVIVIIFLIDCAIFLCSGFAPIFERWLNVGAIPSTMSPQIVLYGFVFFLALQQLFGSYRRRRLFSEGQSNRRTFLSLCVVFSFLCMLGAAAKTTSDYSRLWFFSWMVASLVCIPVAHWLTLARLRRQLAEGAYVYRALAVGIGAQPASQHAVDLDARGEVFVARSIALPNLQALKNLAQLVVYDDIDIVHISVPWTRAPEVFEAISQLNYLSANIFVNPVLDNQRPFLGADTNGAALKIKVLDKPIEGWQLWHKRCLDLIASYIAVFILLPVMLLIALSIKLESRGPIIFRQKRHGFNGRTFEIFKFRSMYVEASDPVAERQTHRGDKRVTRVGRVIRNTSLDELPQLFNVIRGDMSLVGPRPHGISTMAEGNALSEAVREYACRHRVKPGITGWAQVNGLRGELDSIEKLRRRVQRDVEYIENWSIAFDLRILAKTVQLIFRDRGAY